MIIINSNSKRDLDVLAMAHYNILKKGLTKRINAIKGKQWLKSILSNNLKDIITSKPAQLHRIQAHFNREVANNTKRPADIDNVLKSIFIYDIFGKNKNHSYNLAKQLQVNCCPYCNRNYTATVTEKNGKTIIRPDFDHFFPQAKFPLFALSFFNLIPSCALCNRFVKGTRELIYNKYIHPYEEGFGSTFKFNYKALDPDSLIGVKSNYKIVPLLDIKDPKKATRCTNSFDFFKLKDIYEVSHLNEISEIIRKYDTTGGRYLELLSKSLRNKIPLDELYRIAFGNYYEEQDFEKRPLSKLTKDVVEQLQFYSPKIP